MKVSVLLARRAAKRAEAASDKTYIGEVDVSIDDVGDDIAHANAADLISRENQRLEFPAGGSRKEQPVVEVELFAVERSIENSRKEKINRAKPPLRQAGFFGLNFTPEPHLSFPPEALKSGQMNK